MNRNTLVLLVILVILALATFLILQRPGEQSLSESGGALLLAIDSAAVDRIEIHSSNDTLALVREGPDWFLDHPLRYRANQQFVKSLVGALKNAPVKTLASDKPEKYGLFQVDSTGLRVSVSENGKQVGSFFVGKMGPSYADVYVRVSGTNDVVLTDGTLSFAARRSVKDWRDKAIANIPKDEIKSMAYQYGDTTFTLAWRDSVWMIGKDPVSVASVNPLLGSLSAFQTDDFLDALPSPAPRLVATISYANLQLRFFQSKGSDKYIVQSSASPQLFEVPGWRANEVLKRKSAFVKASP